MFLIIDARLSLAAHLASLRRSEWIEELDHRSQWTTVVIFSCGE